MIDARESGTSTGRYVDKLVENLHSLKSGLEIIILTKSPRMDFFKQTAPNFKTIRCDIREFSFAEQYGLVWKIYGIRNDLVHFTMTQQPVLYFGNKVTTIQDLTTTRFRNPAKNWLVFSFKQLVYKWLVKRVAKKSAYVVVPSEYVKRDVAQYAKIPSSKIVVTHEAADKISEPAEPILELDSKQFIVYVGRPQPHKNLERLVEAFLLLKQTDPGLKLALAGKRDVLYERLEKKIKKRGIVDIVFTGFVSEGQLRWLYENCAAYVFPSLSEGFGLPGLEAMIHGAPVVSSSATCLPEIYGQAAHYFDPLDIDDMAEKIRQVINSPELRGRLVKKGLAQAAKYSWANTAEQTLKIYRKALSR